MRPRVMLSLGREGCEGLRDCWGLLPIVSATVEALIRARRLRRLHCGRRSLVLPAVEAFVRTWRLRRLHGPFVAIRVPLVTVHVVIRPGTALSTRLSSRLPR